MAPPTLAPLPNGVHAAFEALARSLEAVEPLPVPTFLRQPKLHVNDYQHDFTAEIEAGVALLDAKLGRATWIRSVYFGTLDLGNEELCLVAQVTCSSYCEGVARLGGPDYNDLAVSAYAPYEWGEAYGFAVPEELCNQHGGFFLYAQLTDQWVRKIGQLRAEVTA